MAQEHDILIQLRRGTEHHWESRQDIILFYGEFAGVYETARDSSGAIILVPDPKVEGAQIAKAGKFLYAICGDGFRTVAEIRADTRLYPIAVETIDAVVAGMQGSCRDFDDITRTDATTSYDSLNAMLYAFRYPYGRPAFTAFTPASYVTREVGTGYNPNISYGWDTSNTPNVKKGSVMLTMEHGGQTVTLASGLDGKSPAGGLAVTGKAAINSGVIGAQTRFSITGRNSKEQAMNTLQRTLTWAGRRCWFMHTNNEWLVQGQTAAIGEKRGGYVGSEATVSALINAALDGGGARSVLGNGGFGEITLPAADADNANGARLYLFYPADYRSTIQIQDPVTKSFYPVKTRPITVQRNGVQVAGFLFAMDILVYGNTLKVNAL